MIYFTAHTFKCVCHCRRAMFRVLGRDVIAGKIEMRPLRWWEESVLPGGDRVKASENLGATSVAPVDTSLLCRP